jgi:class 3 adenylate cyclase
LADAGAIDGASASLAAARAAIARGDLVQAYDLACRSLGAGADGDAAYLKVLALARMGDAEAGMAAYEEHDIAAQPGVDPAALKARLLKDLALAGGSGNFQHAVGEAARAYADIFAATGHGYPGINAASLALIARDRSQAQRLAQEVLALLPAQDRDYWDAATRAEALLLTGDEAGALTAIGAAFQLPGADAGARSTTLRQFELLARHAGLDGEGELRARLRCPPVAVWTGHMFRSHPETEAALAEEIGALIDRHRFGAGYGALAAGADIIIAEQFLARGIDVHVVLPFNVDDFKALSVRPAGEAWEARCDAILARASSLRLVSTVPDIGDPQAISYGGYVTMGLARLRARLLGTRAVQLAVWNGAPPQGDEGTAADVKRWRDSGGETLVVTPPALDRDFDHGPTAPPAGAPPRFPRALVFADVVGFSRLAETDYPAFCDDVMGGIAAILDAAGNKVERRNSWGDAIHFAVTDTSTAARLALALQAELGAVRIGQTAIGLRTGCHWGLVYRYDDPVSGLPSLYGTEVTRAARIEPVTPPGAVYVTESFAAALAMDAPGVFECHYVGQVALAKDFGTFPMYRLARRR